MKERIAKGFTFLKMDLGIPLIRRTPGTLTLPRNYDWKAGRNGGPIPLNLGADVEDWRPCAATNGFRCNALLRLTPPSLNSRVPCSDLAGVQRCIVQPLWST
jgi:hypothetical protein